ncbi:MAG TPA: hypothetical protein VF247_10435 [Candidatus Krumholzibacteria bacterium]
MPRLDTVWVVLLAIPSVAFASPDPARNSAETRVDRRQVAIDRAWNERDAREVSEFERLASTLADASRDRMSGRYREINQQLQAAITREIQQAQVRSAQAAYEAARSRRELSGERMEASMSGDAGEMFDVRDERRDLRGDRVDSERAQARYDEMSRIGTMSAALQNPIERGERKAMKRNVELAANFLALMRRDLAESVAEGRDDRAELREDRLPGR